MRSGGYIGICGIQSSKRPGALMKENKLYLIHISERIDRIESYTAGLDFQAFEKQAMVAALTM